jgi:hypothetical protein
MGILTGTATHGSESLRVASRHKSGSCNLWSWVLVLSTCQTHLQLHYFWLSVGDIGSKISKHVRKKFLPWYWWIAPLYSFWARISINKFETF